MKKNKKAQLKIQQMAFMLMAVFLFFILAGLFYLVIQGQSWKKQAVLLERNNAIEIVNMLAGSPEFSCGAYCVDGDKIMALRNRAAYRNFWKLASIELRKITNESEKLCVDSIYPDCNYIKVYDKGTGKTTVSSFVSLCNRISENGDVENKCELAKLIVGYETKT